MQYPTTRTWPNINGVVDGSDNMTGWWYCFGNSDLVEIVWKRGRCKKAALGFRKVRIFNMRFVHEKMNRYRWPTQVIFFFLGIFLDPVLWLFVPDEFTGNFGTNPWNRSEKSMAPWPDWIDGLPFQQVDIGTIRGAVLFEGVRVFTKHDSFVFCTVKNKTDPSLTQKLWLWMAIVSLLDAYLFQGSESVEQMFL